MRKTARTVSGVTPVAVMTQPRGCPGKCIYCPTYEGAPQSYTPESPAVLRAKLSNYDPKEQIRLRLHVLAEMGHPIDKIELIVMGGTFLAAPVEYQYRFIKDCFDALNGTESVDLAEAKCRNETAVHRCTGLCIETRPDWCGPEEIKRMLDFGTTRVELGVQMLDDEIYRLVRRGHLVKDVVEASACLRNTGLKVHYHWMPGLPGSTPQKDFDLSQMLFSDARFRPDGLKLYPTMVIAGTELERWQQEGRYQPYDNVTMMNTLLMIKTVVPRYVRISRVLRDIPGKYITSGCKESIRSMLKDQMKEQHIECKCIRCREYGHRLIAGRRIGEPHLVRMDYEASGGTEIFLSYEDAGETIFGMLRLRIQSEPLPFQSGTASRTAVVRELHVFGPEVPIKEQITGAVQHKGLGKALLGEAERVAAEEFGITEIAVLSGVGAREYYRESGYTLKQAYMVKDLANYHVQMTAENVNPDLRVL